MIIIGFNGGRIDSTTVKQVLSLGPTFVVMKLIESEILSSFDHINFQLEFLVLMLMQFCLKNAIS